MSSIGRRADNHPRTGYCLRCGGDCFDGIRHRCPPKHPLVGETVALKFACDRALAIMHRRPWARTMTAADYDELRAAIEGMLRALGRGA